MWGAIGDVLAPAVGVALSPLPIVGVILMLLSPRATRLAPALALGWMGAIALIVGAILIFADPESLTDEGGEPSTLVVVIHLVLGAGLVWLAQRQWSKRPKPGTTPEMPAWMQRIDHVSVPAALGLGAMLGGLNPKNLMLNLAAGVSIAQADLATRQGVTVLALYAVLASLSVAAPVIWFLLARASASEALDDLKAWMIQNNAAVMAVVFLLLGVSQIGKAFGGL